MRMSDTNELKKISNLLVTDLLPVNITLAAYGAAIIVGGSILGLAIYFLATQVRQLMLVILVTTTGLYWSRSTNNKKGFLFTG